jgi:hypothetical protein
VALLYHQAPDSLFIAFYDSQGYGGDILTRFLTGCHGLIVLPNVNRTVVSGFILNQKKV